MTLGRGYKSDDQRGAFGAWLLQAMGNMSFDQLAAAMAERGHVHTPNYYTAIAAGSKPGGRAVRQALEDYFGPAPHPEIIPADQSAVVAAIDRQTAVIAELVRELRAVVLLNVDLSTDVAEVVGKLRGIPNLQEDQSSTPPPDRNEPARRTRPASAGTA